MKIKRTVDGCTIEIELTEEELIDAYKEQEQKYDIAFVSLDEDNIAERFGEQPIEYEDALLDVIAEKMRKILNEDSQSRFNALDRAIDEYAKECSRAIKTFDVVFARLGEAKIQTFSLDEARHIAENVLKPCDITWDDNFTVGDIEEEEE